MISELISAGIKYVTGFNPVMLIAGGIAIVGVLGTITYYVNDYNNRGMTILKQENDIQKLNDSIANYESVISTMTRNHSNEMAIKDSAMALMQQAMTSRAELTQSSSALKDDIRRLLDGKKCISDADGIAIVNGVRNLPGIKSTTQNDSSRKTGTDNSR